MNDLTQPIVFDGHNDVLHKLFLAGGPSAASMFVGGRNGHIDGPKAAAGGLGGGFFALWVPSPFDLDRDKKLMSQDSYDLPLPEPVPWAEAASVVATQAATLLRLQEIGALSICKSAADIRDAFETGRLAAIFHMEGAEAIDPDLHMLDLLHAAGLRSLGPVWSRPNVFAEGVPFRFPGSPDIGAGLTERGRALVRRCNDLRIMLDLSHLNEKGFWDIAELSNAPLVATHSNAHAITPHSRNLTDQQLRAIAESDGMVGLNFAVAFLRPDGKMLGGAGPDDVMRHLDHLMDILGEDRVGFGSDYDGAIVPEFVATAEKLPRLRDAMAAHGYGDALIAKLCHGNWLRVLERTWGV